MTLKIRMATVEDAEACNTFHNNIYGTSRTIEQWKWTFMSEINPVSALIYCIAEDEGVIKGTQALIPIRMIDDQGVFLTAKSEETLVSQDLRGIGLFEKMYKQVFSIAAENNIENIWAFTTAIKPFQKVGFKIPMSTSQLLKPCRGKFIYTLFSNNNIKKRDIRKRDHGKKHVFEKILYFTGAGHFIFLFSKFKKEFSKFHIHTKKNFVLRDLTEAPPGLTKLSNTFISQWGGTTILRDEKYLNWRVFNNPFSRANMVGAFMDENLVGYCCFTLDENQMGYIVDIFAARLECTHLEINTIVYHLLDAATNRLSQMGAVAIRGWNMTSHKFDCIVHKQARKLGYLSINRGSNVVLKNISKSERRDQRCEFDNWSVTRIYTEGRSG